MESELRIIVDIALGCVCGGLAFEWRRLRARTVETSEWFGAAYQEPGRAFSFDERAIEGERTFEPTTQLA